MILGLFTGLLAPGGIERIGRHVAAVLVLFAQDRDLQCRFLSLNDPPGLHRLQVGDVVITFQGFGRRKIPFAMAVLVEAPRASLGYIGHVNLAPLGLPLKLLRPNGRYLVGVYGIDVWSRLSLPRRLGLRFANTVTALSRFTAETMLTAQDLKPKKVTLLPPALDPHFLMVNNKSLCPKFPFPSGKVMLTVARLAASERYKGVDTVIQSLPRILEVVPDAYYVVVGDGDDLSRLERLAKDVGVDGHVVFAGIKAGEELFGYYRNCDVFVMPSYAEGFGVVFLEAMACGKPVIGGNHGGTPDVIVAGVTGFLVEYGDMEVLADRIISLLQDEELRKQMGEAGRRRVEKKYTFKHFQDRLTRLLLGESRCGS